jgi:hypothetical protein
MALNKMDLLNHLRSFCQFVDSVEVEDENDKATWWVVTSHKMTDEQAKNIALAIKHYTVPGGPPAPGRSEPPRVTPASMGFIHEDEVKRMNEEQNRVTEEQNARDFEEAKKAEADMHEREAKLEARLVALEKAIEEIRNARNQGNNA